MLGLSDGIDSGARLYSDIQAEAERGRQRRKQREYDEGLAALQSEIAPLPADRQPPPLLARPALSDADVAERVAGLELKRGNTAGYMQGRQQAKASRGEEADLSFGQNFAKFMAGDMSVWPSLITGPNSDPNTPGTIGMEDDGKTFAWTRPDGRIVKMDRQTMIENIKAAHAMGRGNLSAGFSALAEQYARQYREGRDAVGDGFKGREVAVAEGGLKVRQDALNHEVQDSNRKFGWSVFDSNRRFGLEGEKVGLDRLLTNARINDINSGIGQRNLASNNIIGVTADGKGLQTWDRATNKFSVVPLPEGSDAKGLFRRITGDNSRAVTPLDMVKARAELRSAGYDEPSIDRIMDQSFGGGSAMSEFLQNLPPKGGPATTPTAGPANESRPGPATAPPPQNTGRTNFGLFTSRSDLEREAAGGNPYALNYLQGQRRNQFELEQQRSNPGFPY